MMVANDPSRHSSSWPSEIPCTSRRIVYLQRGRSITSRSIDMAKGEQQKKQEKKKPAKTLEEKRAAKREKKANRR